MAVPISLPRRATTRILTGALAAAVALVVVAGCGSSSSPPSAAPSPSTTGPSTTGSSAPPPSTAPSAAGAPNDTLPAGTATIDQATIPVGTVLVDGTGFVLYTLSTDNGGAAPCVAACATSWPPLTGTGIGVADGVPVTPGKFTLVKRPDGTTQVAVDGHPLYRYAGDTQQGQASGQGVGGVWFVVGADGTPIKG